MNRATNYTKLLKIFALLIFILIIPLIYSKDVSAQCSFPSSLGTVTCTDLGYSSEDYCTCCYQSGTTCNIDSCPEGYIPEDPLTFASTCADFQVGNACNFNAPYHQRCVEASEPPPSVDCPSGSMCVNASDCSGAYKTVPSGGSCQLAGIGTGNCCVTTTVCPSDRPACSELTGTLCTSAGGIGISGYCIVDATTVGQCCYTPEPSDPTPDCGGYPEICGCPCGDLIGLNFYCDPGYHYVRTADPLQCGIGYVCCPISDTNCSMCTAAVVPIAGPEVFCVANDPEVRTADPSSGMIATAIGCIPVGSTQGFIGFLLRWGVGIAGGIAFILIIYSGFLVITSGGNPQKLQAGKELLTAAITGLVLLIFGAFILEFIGVDILNIPGFGQ